MKIETIALIFSGISLLIALWQGFLAKQSLDQAKETKSETEKLLDNIKEKVSRIENISDETRKDVKEQISKLIDKQDENFKTLLNSPKENSQNQMIATLLPELLKNPEALKTFAEIGKNSRN